MKTKAILAGIIALTASYCTAYSQDLSQVIRGQVTDIESQTPLAYASIAVITSDTLLGAITDEKGNFRFEEVPVGRHNIQVSYVGYETKIIPEQMVSTGKELVLSIGLKEEIAELDEVVIRAFTKKDKPLNSMATLSARTFSVEEARRYAGGSDDPGRLVASFAGVTTENLRDNNIVIRGNSPKGLLWRIEGVEVPNPNHFANMSTFGGGGISALSALVVGNSDFFTGAFPAEYGNATSGVFDIKLRTGNNEKHEYALQLGTSGIDISSEGPLGKNTLSSYLFNYRYSTMGLVKHVLPEDIKDFLPVYQDLSFKFNAPAKSAGIFSLWGLASADSQVMNAKADSALWETDMDRMDVDFRQKMAAAGVNHRYIFKNNAYMNTSIAISGDLRIMKDDIIGFDLNTYEKDYTRSGNYKLTFTSVYNRKFSARHANRSGVVIDNMHYNTILNYAPDYRTGMISIADEKGTASMVQLFSQSKFSVTNRIDINAGVHGQYFDLNEEVVIEPRFGMTYAINKSQSISLAYGKHSRVEPLTIYYTRVNDGTGTSQPNKDLKLSKSDHLVLAYDVSLNQNMRLKMEPYVQFLYDVPVISDSSFSVLNMEADWYFNHELINTGTGRNTGIDFTLERFLKDGYYFLLTASLFDSKYKGDDGIERNTRFNTNYVFNLLYGKEWNLGAKGNKILGVNARCNYTGGKPVTPINVSQSVLEEAVVYNHTRLLEDKSKGSCFISATINYRANHRNFSGVWSLQISNLLATREKYGLNYNFKTREVEPFEFAVVIPSLSYKIEF